MSWLLRICFAFWLRGRSLINKIIYKASMVSGPLFLRDNKIRLPFMEGVNLPWLRYGNDFGANAWSAEGGVSRPQEREKLRRVFKGLQERGVRTLRWFLFCDGRAGIRFTPAGTPVGPDTFLFADLDTALEIASACRLKIIFVLFDYLWFAKALMIKGVQVRGRSGIINGAYKQWALQRRVLRPLFEHYGSSNVILAWDIINEPEWATRGFGGGISGNAITFLTMRRFIKSTARLIHRYTGHLATVGLGNAAGLTLVRDCGLDFYQVHWYDRWEATAPLDRPVAALDLDRPLLLGEFPTKNSTRPASAIVSACKKNGYCGALAWSLLATDRSSGIDPDN
ncbi:MAG: hypothetical protein E4H23_03820 [Chrysiogenales bacterium]|nr:MAG: hypothetical protein E4H23_03820 [Chrysiogenales bacterium]